MSLQEQINNEIKEAMKAGEKLRLSVLRDMKSAFTKALTEKGRTPRDELTDEEAVGVIKRLAKQRRESIEQYKKGGRNELADYEEQELAILEEYLPEQLSEEEIRDIVKEKMNELDVEDKSGMGKLMGAVMAEVGHRADGNVVKAVVDELLS